jgi:hypothetical protein
MFALMLNSRYKNLKIASIFFSKELRDVVEEYDKKSLFPYVFEDPLVFVPFGYF